MVTKILVKSNKNGTFDIARVERNPGGKFEIKNAEFGSDINRLQMVSDLAYEKHWGVEYVKKIS